MGSGCVLQMLTVEFYRGTGPFLTKEDIYVHIRLEQQKAINCNYF